MLCYTVGLQWLFGLYFGLALFVEEVLVILLQPSCKFVKHENPPGVGLLLACSLVNSCFWFYVYFCKFMSTTYQPCTFFNGTCSVTVTAGVVPQVYFCEKFLEYVSRTIISNIDTMKSHIEYPKTLCQPVFNFSSNERWGSGLRSADESIVSSRSIPYFDGRRVEFAGSWNMLRRNPYRGLEAW